jgi:hypothetical protein
MAKCKGFRTFKERGEWVELVFMARALRLGFRVSKPWGDSSSFDVGVESGDRILRVQLKSTDHRWCSGYLCGFKPGDYTANYTTKKVDHFAAYVLPEDAWYIIPAWVVLSKRSTDLALCPVQKRKLDKYKYEVYREAWGLLLPPATEQEFQAWRVWQPRSWRNKGLSNLPGLALWTRKFRL